jgi:hypothetical protein
LQLERDELNAHRRTAPGFRVAGFLRSLLLGSVIGLALVTQSCSCGNKCSGVTCATAQACDPTDGVCKCGGEEGATGGAGGSGQNGVVCSSTETCNATLQACVSNACASTPACTNGQACDPADGVCKCGAAPCAAGELCDPNSQTCQGTAACIGVVCPAGMSCDSSDGSCRCGGAACSTGEGCIDGGCAVDPCFGVNCTGASTPGTPGNSCYGGICRCGGADGPVCDTGQLCVGGTKTCQPAALCEGTSCEPGAICGPSDGLCHCGAIDGPVCAGGAICVLVATGGDGGSAVDAGSKDAGTGVTDGGHAADAGSGSGGSSGSSGALVGRCLGGNLCAGISCPTGESCDQGSGTCLCGADAGLAGFSCSSTQYCGIAPGATAPTCLTPCNPYDQPPFTSSPDCPKTSGLPDASVVQSCYYLDNLDATLCQAEGPGLDGDSCNSSTDCTSGYGCFAPAIGSDAGGSACWGYCDTFLGGVHGCQIIGRQCLQQAEVSLSDGGTLGIGACEPSGQ